MRVYFLVDIPDETFRDAILIQAEKVAMAKFPEQEVETFPVRRGKSEGAEDFALKLIVKAADPAKLPVAGIIVCTEGNDAFYKALVFHLGKIQEKYRFAGRIPVFRLETGKSRI